MLLKSPGFSALAVAALALGIGANTAIFSVAIAFLKKPIAVPHRDRVVLVMNLAPQVDQDWNTVAPADYFDWKNQTQSFEKMGAFKWADANLTGTGDPEKIQACLFSSNLLDVLEQSPVMGRGFLPSEETIGHDKVAILSYGLWQRRFGSDSHIVGKIAMLDGVSYTIIGVMSKEFNFPASAQIWLPMALRDKDQTVRSDHYLYPVARLKPGVSLRQAQAEMGTITNRIRQQFPREEEGWSVRVMPLDVFVSGVLADEYCEMLIVAVILVLLIACANVSNLLFARSVARQKEIALRRALGASRVRVVRQLLTESVLLAAAGAIIGLGLGYWAIGVIHYYMPPEVEKYLPMWKHVRLEQDVFWYTVAVALVAGLISGLAPAFQSSRADVQEELKEGGRGTTAGRGRQRLRSIFVVAEVSLSLILLVGAGLMSKGVGSLLVATQNLKSEKVLTMRANLPDAKYKTPQQQMQFFAQTLREFETIPGVSLATVSTMVPFGDGGDSDDISIEGRPLQLSEFRFANIVTANPDYFRLMKIPLRSGRLFSPSDGIDNPKVAVVSERFVEKYLHNENPLGKMIKRGKEDSKAALVQIIGVVGDIKYDPFERNEAPYVYFSFLQTPQSYSYMAFRTEGDPGSLVAAVRSRIAAVDPDQPIYDVMPLARVISNQVRGLSYVAVLLSALGCIALVLASIGVYGVMAYSVSERTHEIGVRMALGAGKKEILRVVLKRGILMTFIGLAIGLPLSIGLARLLAGLVFGVSAMDLSTFVFITALLCAITTVACYIPARRAMSVDPMVALRYE
jgi:putative ABC transport system permease protein